MKILFVMVVLVVVVATLVNIEATREGRDRRRMLERDYDRNVRNYDDNNREAARVRDRRDNRQRVAAEYANVDDNGQLMDIFWSYFLKGFTVSVIAYQLLSDKNRPIVKQFLGKYPGKGRPFYDAGHATLHMLRCTVHSVKLTISISIDLGIFEMNELQMVACPFNPVHRVPFLRLQYHIMKCERNHPGFEVCPYDATHRFRLEDMPHHLQECRSARLSSAVFVPQTKPNTDLKPASADTFAVYEDGELWQ